LQVHCSSCSVKRTVEVDEFYCVGMRAFHDDEHRSHHVEFNAISPVSSCRYSFLLPKRGCFIHSLRPESSSTQCTSLRVCSSLRWLPVQPLDLIFQLATVVAENSCPCHRYKTQRKLHNSLVLRKTVQTLVPASRIMQRWLQPMLIVVFWAMHQR
jgi:hypothetical protein